MWNRSKNDLEVVRAGRGYLYKRRYTISHSGGIDECRLPLLYQDIAKDKKEWR